MLTFAQLKQGVRQRVFAAGEARNLRIPHDKSIVDALVDLQRWVECLQNNNTYLVPHCATTYNCGLTSFEFPRAKIHRLSVIDKIDPETGEESADAADDWCSEIEYKQVDPCHIRGYLGRSAQCGTCWPIHLYFAIPQALCGGKSNIPVPTDEGVASGLPVLPLGYHYPQESTNATRRAMSGVWAIEGGRVYVAPWIQSTETIVVRYTGIKRDWVDSDLVDDDPELIRAVDNFLRWEHYRDFEKNAAQADAGERAYKVALSQLIYDCREETRVRECEPIKARGIAPTTVLYFNDRQQATADCPDGQTGNSVTITIPKDTVASTVSVADANQKAIEQARTMAREQLVCEDSGTVYWNTEQSYTAECSGEGNPSTATVPAGKYSSTVSQADANSQALAEAVQQATSDLNCTYWNTAQEYTAECGEGETGDAVTKQVAAHTYSSTVSQSAADQLAYNAAKVAAEEELVCDGQPAVFYNTEKRATLNRACVNGVTQALCSFTVVVIAPPERFTSTASVADANRQAQNAALAMAGTLADQACTLLASGGRCERLISASL